MSTSCLSQERLFWVNSGLEKRTNGRKLLRAWRGSQGEKKTFCRPASFSDLGILQKMWLVPAESFPFPSDLHLHRPQQTWSLYRFRVSWGWARDLKGVLVWLDIQTDLITYVWVMHMRRSIWMFSMMRLFCTWLLTILFHLKQSIYFCVCDSEMCSTFFVIKMLPLRTLRCQTFHIKHKGYSVEMQHKYNSVELTKKRSICVSKCWLNCQLASFEGLPSLEKKNRRRTNAVVERGLFFFLRPVVFRASQSPYKNFSRLCLMRMLHAPAHQSFTLVDPQDVFIWGAMTITRFEEQPAWKCDNMCKRSLEIQVWCWWRMACVFSFISKVCRQSITYLSKSQVQTTSANASDTARLARQMPNSHASVSLCAVLLTPLLWSSSAVGTNKLWEWSAQLRCGAVFKPKSFDIWGWNVVLVQRGYKRHGEVEVFHQHCFRGWLRVMKCQEGRVLIRVLLEEIRDFTLVVHRSSDDCRVAGVMNGLLGQEIKWPSTNNFAPVLLHTSASLSLRHHTRDCSENFESRGLDLVRKRTECRRFHKTWLQPASAWRPQESFCLQHKQLQKCWRRWRVRQSCFEVGQKMVRALSALADALQFETICVVRLVRHAEELGAVHLQL